MEETKKRETPRKEKDNVLQKNHRDSAMQGAFEMCAVEEASEIIPKSSSFEFFCILGNKSSRQCTQIK